MDTSAVFNIAVLDKSSRVYFDADKPWIFDAEWEQLAFATEAEACEAQRKYRVRHGFNPITGETEGRN